MQWPLRVHGVVKLRNVFVRIDYKYVDKKTNRMCSKYHYDTLDIVINSYKEKEVVIAKMIYIRY